MSKKKIILFSILGIIILLGGSFFLYANYLITQEFPQKTEVITPQQPANQKMLIVYQPSSNSDFNENISKVIARGASEKGTEVTLMRPGDGSAIDVKKFDIIVFSTPYYLGTSKKLVDCIQNTNDLSGKEIHLFIVAGSQNTPDMFSPMEKALKGVPASTKLVFSQFDEETNTQKALDYGRRIVED